MIHLDEVFKDKKLNTSKLLAYGFTGDGDYVYRTDIEEDFKLLATINGSVLDYSLTECSTNDEYALVKTAAEGGFVGNLQ